MFKQYPIGLPEEIIERYEKIKRVSHSGSVAAIMRKNLIDSLKVLETEYRVELSDLKEKEKMKEPA